MDNKATARQERVGLMIVSPGVLRMRIGGWGVRFVLATPAEGIGGLAVNCGEDV